MEAYVAPGRPARPRRDRPPAAKPYYHLVLLARDAIGYQNLVKLSSLAYTEGFYSQAARRPRAARQVQRGAHRLVGLHGRRGRRAPHGRRPGRGARSGELVRERSSRTATTSRSRRTRPTGRRSSTRRSSRWPRSSDLPVIATNDAHFLRARGPRLARRAALHRPRQGSQLDADRMRYDRGLYFKSAPEMREQLPRPSGRAREHARASPTRSTSSSRRSTTCPSFPLPTGVDDRERSARAARRRRAPSERYGDPLPANVRERLDYELGVITKTGYAGYFLIVADFIKAARDRGIPVGPGRGSAAGSLVAYSLRITDVCPLKFDLLFERFLNPERVSMPDIDVDFCFERRGEVIEYVRQKYGRDSVGQIVTFGTLKSRAAIKDVGRTLGFTPAETDALAKLIPNQPNFSLTVKEAIEKISRGRRAVQQRRALSAAARLRDRARRAVAPHRRPRRRHRHRAGPARRLRARSARRPRRAPASGDEERVVVTQYDMNCAREGGHAQDGLPRPHDAHGHPRRARRRSRHATGKAPDLDTLPLDDAADLPHAARGPHRRRLPVRVAARDRPAAQHALRPLRRPRRIERADAPRPARRRHAPGLSAGASAARSRSRTRCPSSSEILEPTYGVITYQEQVMRIAQRLAGISLAEADVLRKAVGKKDAELIRVELGKFVEKAVARGYDRTDHRGARRPDRDIRPLRLQQVALGRVLGPLVSHGVAQDALPGRVHGRAALVVDRRHGRVVKYINEARELGHRGAAARRERVGLQVHRRRRQADPLRPRRHPQRRTRGDRLDPRRARPRHLSPRSIDFCERVDLRLCNKRVFEALIDVGRARHPRRPPRAVSRRCSTARSQEASLQQQEAATGQGSLLRRRRRPSTLGRQRTQPSLPNIAPLARVRAARRRRRRSSASTSPAIRSSRSAPSASCSRRTPCRELGHVDRSAAVAGRRRHRDQEADQQDDRAPSSRG